MKILNRQKLYHIKNVVVLVVVIQLRKHDIIFHWLISKVLNTGMWMMRSKAEKYIYEKEQNVCIWEAAMLIRIYESTHWNVYLKKTT